MLFRILILGDGDDSVDVEANNWATALRQALELRGVDRSVMARSTCEIVSESKVVIHTKDGEQAFEVSTIGRAESGLVSVSDDMAGSKKGPRAGTLYPRSLTPGETPEVTVEVPVWSEENLPWQEPSGGHVPVSEAPTAIDIPAMTDDLLETRSDDVTSADDPDLVETIDPAREQTVITSAVDADDIEDPNHWFDESIPENLSDLRQMSQPLRVEDSGADLLARVYEEIQDIDLVGDVIDDGLQFSLELAVRRIPSDAGWLVLTDIKRNDLYFAAATGAHAEDVIDYRIPLGHGVMGYCAESGVSLSLVGDEISLKFSNGLFETIGYPVTSLLCVPLHYNDQNYGVFQLMNSQAEPTYTPKDLDALSYIAKRTAEFLATRMQR